MTVLLTAVTDLLGKAKDVVVRMVNRGFVGVGFPTTLPPLSKQRPISIMEADGAPVVGAGPQAVAPAAALAAAGSAS
ncbi:hypothetical protein A5N17_11720 [Arthrobacter sp. D2]|nr:hypothetical protein AUT26_13540 [Arthrobacter sp. ATCC 21022]NKR16989.1 hypothetical protein [Arthrobacter sp. M6]OEH62701.1 hypothetical protein A5N13_03480 [Arthrobacter sp. D4]OEH63272.1 hypothetical protein A5N17_11720 [Arthrobacter sp. D2]BCW84975.1 hypothetical protein NicSoilE8_26480 [Arthrobacter sp. NicSoilE8]